MKRPHQMGDPAQAQRPSTSLTKISTPSGNRPSARSNAALVAIGVVSGLAFLLANTAQAQGAWAQNTEAQLPKPVIEETPITGTPSSGVQLAQAPLAQSQRMQAHAAESSLSEQTQNNASTSAHFAGDSNEELPLSALPDDDSLATLLWSRHPDFAERRVELAQAEAELGRARLFPNPEFDFSWETIPLGKTNPPGLKRFREVPAYGVGLSQQFELGKRGPRTLAAQREQEAALFAAREALRQHLLDVLERVAEVAEVQARTAIFERLVKDASQLAKLEQRKTEAGEGTGLDAARAQVEEEWFRAGLDDAIADLEEALAACAEAAALRCLPFESEESARNFLIERANAFLKEGSQLEDHLDLKALEAKAEAARQREREAKAHRIPDPEVRLGYLADTYDDADQRHSLNLELAIPIPLFDRGQVESREAASQIANLQIQHSRRLAQLHHERKAARARAEAGARRRDRLNAKTVPLSRRVAEAMEDAVRKGGVPLQEVILARRAQSELELEAAEAELDAFLASLSLYRLQGAQPKTELGKEKR